MKNLLLTATLAIIVVLGYYFGKKLYLKPDLERGVKAVEITGTLPGGEPFSLKSLQGDYVLLDFWGSWCKPCREEHPRLVKLYHAYHEADFKNADGFEIVSFGVERNRDSWVSAIASDQLLWPHHLVSTDLFEDPTLKAYNVRQISTRFLINPKGMVIAVDPNLDEVQKTLENHLRNTTSK